VPHCSTIEGRIEVAAGTPDGVQWAREGLERLVRDQLNIGLSWDGPCLRFEGRPWPELLRVALRTRPGKFLRGALRTRPRLKSVGRINPLFGVRTGEIRVVGDETKVIVEYQLNYRVTWSWRMILPQIVIAVVCGDYLPVFGYGNRGSTSDIAFYFQIATMRGITESAQQQINELQTR